MDCSSLLYHRSVVELQAELITVHKQYLLPCKSSWNAPTAVAVFSSRHWAREDRALLRTVGALSEQRPNTMTWIRNLCCRNCTCSGGTASSAWRSGCSSRAIATSSANTRYGICARQHRQKGRVKTPLKQHFATNPKRHCRALLLCMRC